MRSEQVANFFAYARERYRIYLRREGAVDHWSEAIPKSGKWTNNHILQQYRFCNVFREDDTVTKWIRTNINERSYSTGIIRALVIARWFNRVSTLELLHEKPSMFYHWDSAEVRRRLKDTHPIVTGAYMIKTPKGINKLNGLIWCIEQFMNMVDKEVEADGAELPTTLQDMTTWLATTPFLGPFMAYEVATDLRHTPLLCNASDIMTWANPGPGANRGLGRIWAENPLEFKSRTKEDQAFMQQCMGDLLKESQKDLHWPSKWPKWEMREVEHTLCEFDKYERVRLGEGKPKQLYKGGA